MERDFRDDERFARPTTLDHDLVRSAPAVGKVTRTQRLPAQLTAAQRADRQMRVQLSRDAHTGLDDHEVTAAAAHGVADSGGQLPYLDQIQAAFGVHELADVRAHVGGAAAEASGTLGAHAYATGNDVAFASQPSLFLAAHEATHVVQQRSGVHLSSAVGHAGDAYEQQADAVAARVVAGESAEDLLGSPATASVQRSAIQRDAELGPAGRGAFGMSSDAYYPAASKPTPKAPSSVDKGLGLAKAALPMIKQALGAIDAMEGVWDLVKGGSASSSEQLPSEVTPFNHDELERVYRYQIAKAFIDRAMEIGRAHGVDFSTWIMGRPSPVDQLLADVNALTKPPPAPQPNAPDAAAPKPDGSDAAPTQSPEVKNLIEALQALGAQDRETRAKQHIHGLIKDDISVEPVSWWWNGDGETGLGEPPPGMGGAATWGQLTFYVSVKRVWEAKAGIPLEASHFGVPPSERSVKHLMWFSGGRVEIRTQEGSFDDVSVKQTERSPRTTENAPVGAHHLAYMFQWDNNTTSVELDLTVDADLMQASLRNIRPDGRKPRT